MRYVRIGQPWVAILGWRSRLVGSPLPRGEGTDSARTFLRLEALAGLIVGLGSVAVTVPGTVTRLPPASAVLLLPLLGFVAYGILVLRRHPRRPDASMPACERRLVRRRTIGWAVVLVVAVVVPLNWVWPLFVAGSLGVVYSIRQACQQFPQLRWWRRSSSSASRD